MAQLLLSQKYLREKTLIDDNVDYLKITPIIEDVQETYLQDLIGSDLYDQIIEQSTPPTSLTAQNEELLNEHILKVLTFYLYYELPMPMKFRYMNKGIMVKSSENGQPIADEEIKVLTDRWKNKAERYGEKMLKFIRANPGDYPAFFSNQGIGKELPKGTAFDIDIFLEDTGHDLADYDCRNDE